MASIDISVEIFFISINKSGNNQVIIRSEEYMNRYFFFSNQTLLSDAKFLSATASKSLHQCPLLSLHEYAFALLGENETLSILNKMRT